jgi:spore germination protein GerM
MAASALSGCGVPDDRDVRPIDRTLPFGLGTPRATASPSGEPASREIAIYLVRSDRLVAVRHAGDRGPVEQAALKELLGGPTAGDLRRGLSSALPPGLHAELVSVEAGAARVDVSAELVQVRGEQQLLAIAQIVLTLASTKTVVSVRFDLDGSPIQVPISDGSLVERPVTAADYLSLRT